MVRTLQEDIKRQANIVKKAASGTRRQRRRGMRTLNREQGNKTKSITGNSKFAPKIKGLKDPRAVGPAGANAETKKIRAFKAAKKSGGVVKMGGSLKTAKQTVKSTAMRSLLSGGVRAFGGVASVAAGVLASKPLNAGEDAIVKQRNSQFRKTRKSAPKKKPVGKKFKGFSLMTTK